MLLKIMSAENAADDDSRKTFQLHDGVSTVSFEREPDGLNPGGEQRAQAHATFADNTTCVFDVPGNAYVMNDNGKTVASFGSAGLPGHYRVDEKREPRKGDRGPIER
jgi:hypothetical protein